MTFTKSFCQDPKLDKNAGLVHANSDATVCPFGTQGTSATPTKDYYYRSVHDSENNLQQPSEPTFEFGIIPNLHTVTFPT